MPSRYPYQTTIRNPYLGVSKVIRAMNPEELTWLIDAQLAKWHEQEERRRLKNEKDDHRLAAKQAVEELKSQAQSETVTVHHPGSSCGAGRPLR